MLFPHKDFGLNEFLEIKEHFGVEDTSHCVLLNSLEFDVNDCPVRAHTTKKEQRGPRPHHFPEIALVFMSKVVLCVCVSHVLYISLSLSLSPGAHRRLQYKVAPRSARVKTHTNNGMIERTNNFFIIFFSSCCCLLLFNHHVANIEKGNDRARR